jgi:hypothetical protein
MPLMRAIQPMTEVKKADAKAGMSIANMPIIIKPILQAIIHPRDCFNSAAA